MRKEEERMKREEEERTQNRKRQSKKPEKKCDEPIEGLLFLETNDSNNCHRYLKGWKNRLDLDDFAKIQVFISRGNKTLQLITTFFSLTSARSQ